MSNLLKLIVPEKIEVLFYLILSFALIMLIDFKTYLSYLVDVSQRHSVDPTMMLKDSILRWVVKFETLIDPRISDFVVWTIIGLGVVGLILSIDAIFNSMREEKNLIDVLNAPRNRKQETRLYLIKFCIRAGALLGIMVLSRILVTEILPGMAGAFFISSISLSITAVAVMLFAVMVVALFLYFLALLSRLLLLRPRVFGSDSY